jgi:hypothetical protein
LKEIVAVYAAVPAADADPPSPAEALLRGWANSSCSFAFFIELIQIKRTSVCLVTTAYILRI